MNMQNCNSKGFQILNGLLSGVLGAIEMFV